MAAVGRVQHLVVGQYGPGASDMTSSTLGEVVSMVC